MRFRSPELGNVIKAIENPVTYSSSTACSYELVEFCHQPPAITVVENDQEEPELSEAELIIQEALAKADEILNTAKEEIDAIYTQAYQEGYQAGVDQADSEALKRKNEIDAKTQQLVNRLESDISQAAQDRLDMINSVEPAL